jgi:TonB-dependent SusC/RagA subfamily outer membrane receptor
MKDLQLLLTDPCSQQWDDMEQTGIGRYCEHCDKNIIDLTNKTDAELIHFFKRKDDKVCGRLLSSQLNRKLVQPPSRLSWQWLLPFAVGTIAVSPAQALGLRPAVIQNSQTLDTIKAPAESAKTLRKKGDSITGKVVDSQTGKALGGVKIRQKGFTNVLAITDSTGRFELGITISDIAIPYSFELNGYSKVETSLNSDMLIKLSVQRIMLGALSSVSGIQTPLYVVFAGKKSCTVNASKFSEISTDWIENIEILKDAKATALYGFKGANGVILIRIKKAYKNKFDFSQRD